MANKKTKIPKLELKVPMENKCRRKSKKLVDPCELPAHWKDKNRFKQNT